MDLRLKARRAAFMARLVLQVMGRALPTRAGPPAPPAPPPAANLPDYDRLIEALQVGDLGLLATCGPGFATSQDGWGQPWFFTALDMGSPAVVDWFLLQGADPEMTDKSGRTALEALVERACLVDEFDEDPVDAVPLISALIASGADVNARGRQGLTALHRAAGMGATEVVASLLDHGADPTLTDEGFSGSTPLDFAITAKAEDVAGLLRARTAQPKRR